MAEADPRKPDFVNVHEAKTHFSRLLDRAHGGEEIVIAKAGTPYAKLVPIEPQVQERRQPGGLEHLGIDIPDSVWFDSLDDNELDAWEGKYSSSF